MTSTTHIFGLSNRSNQMSDIGILIVGLGVGFIVGMAFAVVMMIKRPWVGSDGNWYHVARLNENRP